MWPRVQSTAVRIPHRAPESREDLWTLGVFINKKGQPGLFFSTHVGMSPRLARAFGALSWNVTWHGGGNRISEIIRHAEGERRAVRRIPNLKPSGLVAAATAVDADRRTREPLVK